MKISLLCSSSDHPVNTYLQKWKSCNEAKHDIQLARHKEELCGGDLLFLISCNQILRAEDRSAYRSTLILHASDLPHGRGWSPHVWSIIDGAENITLSLLEAEDKVDSGRIWKKIMVDIPKHALWNEINHALFSAELELIDYAIMNFENISPAEQSTAIEPTYFRRRTVDDSRLDPERSIAQQFDLIRVCDPMRYPAFFELHGQRYKLIVKKLDE